MWFIDNIFRESISHHQVKNQRSKISFKNEKNVRQKMLTNDYYQQIEGLAMGSVPDKGWL